MHSGPALFIFCALFVSNPERKEREYDTKEGEHDAKEREHDEKERERDEKE